MVRAILLLPLLSFAISWCTTLLVRRLAPRLGFVDKPGGRKIHANPKPLGGGVAIFAGVALPLVAILLLLYTPAFGEHAGRFSAPFVRGAHEHTPLALGLLGTMLAMHLLGLWDDRKALGPYLKLALQLGAIGAFVTLSDSRALTALDHLGLGRTPSIVFTVLWIGAITNAFNFLDNMDGLSAGVAAVCTTAFCIAALSIQQWFVASALAMLLGSLLGFLCFNFPPATIFMGDSGSLIIGLMMGVLTVRTTYLLPGTPWTTGWYAVFAPAIVLAVPLYDLIVVSLIRLSRGRSPFVGDTNHFSHRLVARGMSRRTAVLCLYLITASTSVAAVLLPHVSAHFAPLIFVQTLLILGVVALLEQHPLPIASSAADSPSDCTDRAAAAPTQSPAAGEAPSTPAPSSAAWRS
jgi:UDP-GlcNAc:undecaprenyl-phosphate GlcNAc-1-phosphate transferase